MTKNKVWKQFLAQIANFSCKEFIINNETEHTMSYIVNFDKLPPSAKQPETLTIKTVNDKLDRLTSIVFDFIQEQKKFNEEQKKFNEDQKKFNSEQIKFNELVITRLDRIEIRLDKHDELFKKHGWLD